MKRNTEALKDAACTVWKFVLPLVEVMSPKIRAFVDEDSSLNRLSHKRDLVTHRSRTAPAPNNDTLYSAAHLDLSAGPIDITLPATGDRYISVALMDAWSDTIAILGTRTTGKQGGTFRLVGPQARDAVATTSAAIVSPTRYVWCLGRILVDGEQDLARAHHVQDGLTLTAPAVPDTRTTIDCESGWAEYFARASALLKDNPPTNVDKTQSDALALLGMDQFDPAQFNQSEIDAIRAGIEMARLELTRVRASTINQGWAYPASHLGDFGTDFDFRALVAISGIGALPPQEAIYLRALGDLKGARFDGNKTWCLRIPADAPIPVDGFWSLSLYEVLPGGQLFFTENQLNRYSIGDRTPGLVACADGATEIWISHHHPGVGKESNWLPAPGGPFALILRAYMPQPALLTGKYRIPRIEQVT